MFSSLTINFLVIVNVISHHPFLIKILNNLLADFFSSSVIPGSSYSLASQLQSFHKQQKLFLLKLHSTLYLRHLGHFKLFLIDSSLSCLCFLSFVIAVKVSFSSQLTKQTISLSSPLNFNVLI